MVFTSRNWFAMQGPVAIILISWNVIFIWGTGYWTRAIKRFALFDLLKSLYSDTKILQVQYHTQYISINIHSTIYQHNYKISIFWQKSSAKPKAAKKCKMYLLKKNWLISYFLFSTANYLWHVLYYNSNIIIWIVI
jgi:hypothetical protein